MNYATYRVPLDIHNTSSQALLSFKKDDSARKIYFSLTECGRTYQITEGCTAIFRAKKPDGTILYNSCDIVDNVIEYTLTNQTSAAVGVLDCEVTLYGADSIQITSPRFAICIVDTLYSDSEVESANEFSALSTAISACENLNANVEKVGDTATITVTRKDGTIVMVNITDGKNGQDGTNGIDGKNGADGVGIRNILINKSGELEITLTSGTVVELGKIVGADGKDGADGTGVSETSINALGELIISYSDGISVNLGCVVGADGPAGADGKDGADGYTPQKGVDYWTDEDKTEIVNAVIAALPDGSEVSY